MRRPRSLIIDAPSIAAGCSSGRKLIIHYVSPLEPARHLISTPMEGARAWSARLSQTAGGQSCGGQSCQLSSNCLSLWCRRSAIGDRRPAIGRRQTRAGQLAAASLYRAEAATISACRWPRQLQRRVPSPSSIQSRRRRRSLGAEMLPAGWLAGWLAQGSLGPSGALSQRALCCMINQVRALAATLGTPSKAKCGQERALSLSSACSRPD